MFPLHPSSLSKHTHINEVTRTHTRKHARNHTGSLPTTVKSAYSSHVLLWPRLDVNNVRAYVDKLRPGGKWRVLPSATRIRGSVSDTVTLRPPISHREMLLMGIATEGGAKRKRKKKCCVCSVCSCISLVPIRLFIFFYLYFSSFSCFRIIFFHFSSFYFLNVYFLFFEGGGYLLINYSLTLFSLPPPPSSPFCFVFFSYKLFTFLIPFAKTLLLLYFLLLIIFRLLFLHPFFSLLHFIMILLSANYLHVHSFPFPPLLPSLLLFHLHLNSSHPSHYHAAS